MKNLGSMDSNIFEGIVRISEKDKRYVHKILEGPNKVSVVFYPSVDINGKDIIAAVSVKDWKSSPFFHWAQLDRTMQARDIESRLTGKEKENALKGVSSTLDPSSFWRALILDRTDISEEATVKLAEYKYGAFDDITKAMRARAVDSTTGQEIPTLLKYGLLCTIWFDIRKTKKFTDKPDSDFNIQYTAQPIDELCPLKGKVDSKWLPKPGIFMEVDETNNLILLKSPTADAKIPVLEWGIFTEPEWEAVCKYEHSLEEFTQVQDHDTMKQKLLEFPLKIDGKDKDGNFVMPHWEKLLKEAKSAGIPLSYQVGAAPQLAPPEVIKDQIIEDKKKDPLKDILGEKEWRI